MKNCNFHILLVCKITFSPSFLRIFATYEHTVVSVPMHSFISFAFVLAVMQCYFVRTYFIRNSFTVKQTLTQRFLSRKLALPNANGFLESSKDINVYVDKSGFIHPAVLEMVRLY